jgi:hypothetical protein
MSLLDMMHLLGNVFKDHLIKLLTESRVTFNKSAAAEVKEAERAGEIARAGAAGAAAGYAAAARDAAVEEEQEEKVATKVAKKRGRPKTKVATRVARESGASRADQAPAAAAAASIRQTRSTKRNLTQTSPRNVSPDGQSSSASDAEVKSDLESFDLEEDSDDSDRSEVRHKSRHNVAKPAASTRVSRMSRSKISRSRLTSAYVVPPMPDVEESEGSDISVTDDELDGSHIQVGVSHICYLCCGLCRSLCCSLCRILFLCPVSQPWSIGKVQRRFVIPESHRLVLEQRCLQFIQAPPGVVNPHPMSLSGQNNTYHWLNFVRVHGKYLFSQYFTGSVLKLFCAMIDLVKHLLSNIITTPLLHVIDVLIKRICKNLPILPNTERPIVFHNLLFHMPTIIAKWGPARSYWCFPFERYLIATQCCSMLHNVATCHY